MTTETKPEQKKPREWWIANQPNGKNISNTVDLFTATKVKPDNPPWTHVVEMYALEEAKKWEMHWAAKFAEEESKVIEAKKEIERLKGKQICYCSYCSFESKVGEASWGELQEHIKVCPFHPLTAANGLIEKLEKALEYAAGQLEHAGYTKNAVPATREALALIKEHKERR